jgi:predicted DNA-binding transcriptional regulator YafY
MDVIIRMGRKNLAGWCRLRNDWRTFRIDRINFISILMNEDFQPRADYKRTDFEDEGVVYQHVEKPERIDRNDPAPTTMNSRPNKEFAFNTNNIKTMSENKLDFSKDNVKEYSEDEDDLSL